MTTSTHAQSEPSYYEKNKDRIKASRALHYQENKAAIKAKSAEWYKTNKSRVAEVGKAYRDANPDEMKSKDLLRRYGITLEQRDALFTSQGSVCAVCASDTPGGKGWHVDHCHRTQAVRGILCHHCNLMLGNAKDNPATLAAAITYLSH